MRDILGLANFLKEQKSCKIVIILNDGAFKDSADETDYEEYFEKTVDRHVTFAPSPRTACSIAFEGIHSKFQDAIDAAEALEITNIRVLLRLKNLTEELAPNLANCEAPVVRDCLNALAVLTWSRFVKDAAPIAFVRENLLTGNDSELGTEDERSSWSTKLQKSGFTYFSSLDEALLSGIETGFFDIELLNRELDQANDAAKKNATRSSYSEVWRRFHDSFDDDGDVFVDELVESFKMNVPYMSVPNADSTIETIKELGNEKVASELVSLFVSNRPPDELEEGSAMWRPVKNVALKEAIERATAEGRRPADLSTALMSLASNSWDDDDSLAVQLATEQELLSAFRELRGPDQTECVKAALRFGGDVTVRAQAALRTLANESAINRVRIKYRFNLDFDNDRQ